MPTLQQYVASQLAAGYSIGELRTALLSSGWGEAEVNAAIAQGQAGQLRAQDKPQGRAAFGSALAILAGLDLILFAPAVTAAVQSLSVLFPPLVRVGGGGAELLSIVYGFGILIGGLLAWKGRKAGGALTILLALLYFAFGGHVVLALVALVAGILGVKGK